MTSHRSSWLRWRVLLPVRLVPSSAVSVTCAWGNLFALADAMRMDPRDLVEKVDE